MGRILKFALVGSLAISLSAVFPMASNAETNIGGKLPQGFVFTKASSPYRVTDTLLVDEGNLVKVEPGVTIFLPKNKPLFWSLGSLELNGTESQKIQLVGQKGSFLKLTNAPRGISLKIQHVMFDSVGSLFEDIPANTDSIAVSISDSDFHRTIISSWYPSRFELVRNVFLDGSGVMLGYSYNPEAAGSQPAMIRNNLFTGTPGATSIYGSSSLLMWVNVWAAYGGDVLVRGNTFVPSKHIALNASVDGTIDASGNYWQTTDPVEIQKYVLDKADSFDWKNFIKVGNPLQNTDTATPAAARFQIKSTSPAPNASTKPVAARKYANCTELRKVYKGGVARSSNWVNKGSRIKQFPTVSIKTYDLNKGLDRDRDGIVCES